MNKDFELIKNWQKDNVYVRFFAAAVVVASLPLLKRVNHFGIIAGIIILAVYNTFIFVAIKKNKFREWMNYYLLFMDMFVMSIGVYSTGGVESPLYNLYFISFLDSVILLKPREVFPTLGGVASLYSIACFEDLLTPASWKLFATRIVFFFIASIVSFSSSKLGVKRIILREVAIEREERFSARLKLLWGVVSELMPMEEIEKLFERMTEHVQKSLGYPYVSIMIYEEERGGLVFKGGSGEWKELTPAGFVQKVSEGLIGKCFREGRTIFVNDVSKAPEYIAPYLVRTRSEVDVPIRTDAEVLGVLDIQSDKINEFEEEDVILLEILGDILGIIIENASLYSELKTAYKELTEVQEKIILAEKLELIDEISKEVAHNFQNIFSVIKGRLEFVFFKNPSQEIQKDLDEIRKAVDSGIKIVENFYMSLKESKEVLKKLESSEIIEEALKSCENYLKERPSINHVSIEKSYNHKKLIYGNKELLTQAFFNVILNSFEAMKEGGILKIETRDFEDFVEIRIMDTGTGMGEDTKKRIFQPFFSTKKQRKEFFGLYNTYRIVSFHRGELDVISEKGRGTTVIMRIPSATPS